MTTLMNLQAKLHDRTASVLTVSAGKVEVRVVLLSRTSPRPTLTT